jgi:hypothetical protein
MLGTVEIKTRPVRLAYLVDPNNTSQIRESIRLSSSLWGGAYFPIVPLYKRLPAAWTDKPLKPPPAKNVILGYIEAFDPDVLVQLSREMPEFVTATGRKIIKPSEIWNVLETPRTLSPQFGIGIVELLDDVFENYFRYKAKYPMRVILPHIPRQYNLFWTSIFGEVPQKLMPILNAQFRDPLDIEEAAFTSNNLTDMLSEDVLFPRRIAQYGLRHTNRAGFRDRARVFFLMQQKLRIS